MATTVYEYGTPCLGGYVNGKKIFLTFSHWGVQCIDTKSNHILSTWNRPTSNDQFTCGISYSNDHKWFLSSVFNKEDKKCNLLLWNSNDLDLKEKSIDIPTLQESEFILRVFHSGICHHLFIMITNLGNILLFDPIQKTFDYKANSHSNNNLSLIHVNLHDAISSSGYHKKLTHLSLIYASNEQQAQQMQIIPISFNTKSNSLSVHDAIQLSLPKNVYFYATETETAQMVVSYDWCLDTNRLLLLTNDASIKCIEYLHAKSSNNVWKYSIKYVISIAEHLDTSVFNVLNAQKLKDANELYAMQDTALLCYVRIKFIESSQFIVIGPSNKEYNTLKLFTFQSEHGFLRDTLTLCPQSVHSKLLMIAPIVSIIKRHKSNTNMDNMQWIDVYAITSKQVVYVRLPSLGRSLLDLVENSIKNEYKMNVDQDKDEDVMVLTLSNVARIQRFVDKTDWKDAERLLSELVEHNNKIEQHSFNVMMDCFVDNEKWSLLKQYFVLVKDHNETHLLYLLSSIMSHLKYCGDNKAFVCCLNTILSAKINDIFMKRCLQILPQSQVEMLIKYLCDKVDQYEDEKELKMEVIISWFHIILDAHLATLAFTKDNELFETYIVKIRQCLIRYSKKINSMMSIQANIHSVLNVMKVEMNNNKKKQNSSKPTHGIGGGAFASNSKLNNDENDPNLYKDYVVEYIKL